MPLDPARRARGKKIQADLAKAYEDDEASPPEWVDLLASVKDATAALEALVAEETERFVSDPDVRRALERRSRVDASVRGRVEEVNAKVRRLNLIAPHARFTRPALDPEVLLRPLYRSSRQPGGAMPSAPSVRGPGMPRNP